MTMSTLNPPHSVGKKTEQGFGSALLDLISNVWFGVTLLVILFFYCSIGSAVHSVREHPLIEMTEFEWFHWWPFDVLILALCISLALTTIRRIPLRKVNAGVWMIHSGIIILCLGSYYYFGTKIEGDAPVFRRSLSIQVPGVPTLAELVCVPGASTSVVDGAGAGLGPRYLQVSRNLVRHAAVDYAASRSPPRGGLMVGRLLVGRRRPPLGSGGSFPRSAAYTACILRPNPVSLAP